MMEMTTTELRDATKAIHPKAKCVWGPVPSPSHGKYIKEWCIVLPLDNGNVRLLGHSGSQREAWETALHRLRQKA